VLTASVVELHPLRYTPAGVPALNLTLAHESQVQEAQALRQVQFEVASVVLGPLADTLAQQPVGSRGVFTGFMANRRNRKSLVFHIQQFSLE